jgi:hypothetical protein
MTECELTRFRQKMHCRATHEAEKEIKDKLKKYYNIERRKNTVNIEIIKI